VSAPAVAKPRSGRFGRLGLGLIFPVALIVVWQLVKSTGILSYQDIPAPSAIVSAAGSMIATGEFSDAIGHTLAACLGGWVLGSVAGLVLGAVLGLSRPAYTYGMASVDVLRAIPAIAFVPIAVIVLAQTLQMEIVIAAWVSVWPVAISTIDGVRGVSAVHQDLARSLRLSPLRRTLTFALPTAMPRILVALRLGMSGALVLAIVAEIVGNPAGIGNALVQDQQTLRPDSMFAYILVTGLLGLVLNFVLTWLLEHLVPGGRIRPAGGRDDDH
jgi:ABC-type nitrate/sulfonate/bicarbonate transport system permease component